MFKKASTSPCQRRFIPGEPRLHRVLCQDVQGLLGEVGLAPGPRLRQLLLLLLLLLSLVAELVCQQHTQQPLVLKEVCPPGFGGCGEMEAQVQLALGG